MEQILTWSIGACVLACPIVCAILGARMDGWRFGIAAFLGLLLGPIGLFIGYFMIKRDQRPSGYDPNKYR